jgi:hypothetical protein
VLRAGYGMYYSLTPSVLTYRADFRNGLSVQPRLFSGSDQSAALIPSYPRNFCGPPDLSGSLPSCAAPAIIGASAPLLQLFSSSYRQPYVQHASTGFEVAVSHGIAVGAGYLLSKGTHLPWIRDVNLGTPTSNARISTDDGQELVYERFTLPRPITLFDRILTFQSGGNSIYHGLVIQVRDRFTSKLQFLSSYTLGKVVDDNSNIYALNIGPFNTGLLSNAARPQMDRGPGSNDQRQRFVLSGVWELNYTQHMSPFWRRLFGGWTLSGILVAQTGQPYSGHLYFDLNNDGVLGTDRTPELGRNTFYTPTTVSVDPRLSRSFPFGERFKLHFALDAFNVFNRANIVGVNDQQYSVANCSTLGNQCLVPNTGGLSSFGSPAASSGPRIVQLSLRLEFR